MNTEIGTPPFPKWIGIFTKITFLGLIVFCIVGRQWPQFSGKGMMLRASTYPLAALAVPLFWRFKLRGRPYPHLADAFILLPFVVDLFGNAANLFDTIRIYDDTAHFVNWIFLVSGFGILFSSFNLRRLNIAVLSLGLGCAIAILWELAEFIAQKTGTTRLFLTYEDTIGDLGLAFAGSFLGALTSAVIFYRKRPITNHANQ
jgi:hypothetical protein